MNGNALRDLAEMLSGLASTARAAPTVPVGVSGRHVHLSQEALDRLFGPGARLTPLKELSQPGQFAAKECVTLVGSKGVVQRVRVLGPVRPRTQVEVLRGDTFRLGMEPCVRLSGHLEGTPGITLAGPAGVLTLTEGVIVAARHLHLSTAEAAAMGVADGQAVSLLCEGERPGRLDGVVVRADDRSALDCHIDTEEANAFGLSNGSRLRLLV